MALDRLFQLMAEKNASDLFISVGSPVTIKINGVCVPVNQERLVPEQVIGLLAERLIQNIKLPTVTAFIIVSVQGPKSVCTQCFTL